MSGAHVTLDDVRRKRKKKEVKGDRPLFSGIVPFSPFVKEDRDCPSSLKKRGLSPFSLWLPLKVASSIPVYFHTHCLEENRLAYLQSVSMRII
jgi:hypothetical protein